MKKRAWSLGIVILLCSEVIIAQTDTFNFPSVAGFGSPTASSMVKVEQIPVDYYNGTASTSIPLHVFSYYQHNIPISLSYQSTGLRVQERASWVGLGWALNAGGVVNRTLHGMPDDHSSGKGYIQHENFITHTGLDINDTDDRKILEKISDGDYDAEPDLFTVSTPTFSGEFAYIDGQFRFKSRQNVKIQMTYSGSYKIASFIMTDESGIKYTFGQQENTKVVSHSGGTPMPTQNYVSAWYLTKIEHPQVPHDVILEYDTTGYNSTQDTESQGRRVYKTATNPVSCSDLTDDFFVSVTTTTNTAIYLKKIKGETPAGLFSIDFTLESRTDLGVEKRLKSIEITENGETQKEIQFGYGYFGSGSNTRLKLTSVQEYDKLGTTALPAHTFEYYSGTIPAYDSKGMDHWGYYNGASNINLVPTAYTGGSSGTLIYSSTTNRDPISSSTSMLKKITYPTGGTSSFTYERNNYGYIRNVAESATKNAGGMRIKTITNHDGVSTSNDIVKNISYGMDDGSNLSSGRIEDDPILVDTGNREYFDGSINNTCAYYDIKPASFFGIGHYSSNHLGYKKVTESIATASDYGKTVHTFEKHTYRLRGMLTGTKVYDNSITPKLMQQSDMVNQYSYTSGDYSTGLQVTQKIYSNYIGGGVNEDTVFQVNSYGVYQSWDYVSSETSKVYNGETGYVETGKVYNYESGTRTLLRSVTETAEGLTSNKTTYKYASEQYSAMNTAHMYSQLYSILIESGTTDISKGWMEWTNSSSVSPGSIWRPWKQWSWEGTGTAPSTPSTSNSIKTSEVTSYDSYGNPVEVKDVNDVKSSYDWSKNGTAPIGVFRNADSDDVYAHSFAYDGLDDWVLDDRNSDGDTEATVVDGKLKLKNYASAANSERDNLGFNLGSEITGSLVWEFDVKIANSNERDLQMNTGGSSWDYFAASAIKESAVWTTINNESWNVYDGTSWVTLKSGLIVGDTYRFKIVMHPGTNKADYYLNGELLNSDVNFRFSVSGIQKFAFGNYGYGSVTTEWYIDNIRIYPEESRAQSAEVDPLFGTLLTIKDVSGSTNRYSYDNFGRLTEAFNTNEEKVSSNSYYYSLDGNSSYTTTDPNRVESIAYYDPANSSNNIKSISYLDGLGRQIQNQIRGITKVIATETLYNKRGLPKIVSRPAEVTGSGYLANMLAGSYNGTTGELELNNTSLVESYYDGYVGSDATYAYLFSGYETTPLARATTSQLPGATNRITSTSYSLNTTETFATAAVSGLVGAKTWAANTLTKTLSEDPSGNKTITYTNARGQVIASGVDMDNNSKLDRSTTDLVTEFAYDDQGNLAVTEDPRGLQTKYWYNTLGQLEEKELPDQDNSENYKYDDKGRVRFIEKSSHKESGSSATESLDQPFAGVTRTISPTKAGLLTFSVSIAPDDGGYTGEIKDVSNGDRVLLSDFVGNDGGWEISVSGSMAVAPGSYKFSGDVTSSYDDNEDIQGTYAFKPFLYTYTKYDDFDRVIEAGEYYGTTSFSSANTNTSTFPTTDKQVMVEYKYDTPITYTGANNTKGRLTEVWYYDPYNPGTVVGKSFYSYNALGLVEWIIQRIPGLSGDKKITYTYDELGRQTEMGYNVTNSSDDHYFWYEYDELGRLEYVYSDTDSNPTGRIKEAEYVSYSADGQVAQMKLGNGNIQTVDYAYTVQGWLNSLNNSSVSTSTNGDRFALALDYANNGNITTQTWMQSSLSAAYSVKYDYTYDKANRLTAADYTNNNSSALDDNSNGHDISPITYDKNGNITSIIRKGQGYYSYPFNSITSTTISGTSNRLTSYGLQNGPVPSSTKTVTYDASGNILQNRFTNAAYDGRNLMTSVKSGTTTIEFGYDGEANRVRKEVIGGTESFYVRGADGQTIAVYENGSRAFVNLLAEGQILGNYDGSQRRYFLKDHLGTIRTTVDQSGNVDGYDDYYPFGLVMGGRSNNTSNPDDLYKFTGHERDDEAGLDLDYMMARNYDPVIGRFMQIDPMLQYSSPYTYVGNNPLLLTDPTGMLGDYFTEEGEHVGNDGIDDDKVYITENSDNLSRSKDGTVTGPNDATYVGQRDDFLDLNGNNISSSELQNNLIGLSIYMGNNDITEGFSTITVTGGNRDSGRNAAVGGARNSRHLVGDAADIKSSQVNNATLANAAYNSGLFNTTIDYPPVNAIGALRPHVHVDLRQRPTNTLLLYTPVVRNGRVVNNSYSRKKN